MTSASDLRSGKTHRDENFPVASWIIHPRHRALILAFYNFVRTADDTIFGTFVKPEMSAFQAAAANADWKNAPGFYEILTDQAYGTMIRSH